jgi:aspartate/glutamate racemase
MESGFYGVDVVAPASGLLDVHEAYVSKTSAGIATAAQRELFLRAGVALTSQQCCEAVMLAGTDLALVFRQGDAPGVETLDCAALHVAAIATTAMSS